MALSLPDGLTLYFARHGQTEGNVQKRFQGRTADQPLTALGEAQARDLAAIVMREAGPARVSTLGYVASPLPRARATMEIARAALNLAPDGYTTDDRLQEIDLGGYDGLTDAQARARYPQAWHARALDKWTARYPGGENYADVAARAQSWIGDLACDTFAVSHGAFTRILRGLFGGLDWRGMSALDEPQGVLFRVRGSTVERLEAR